MHGQADLKAKPPPVAQEAAAQIETAVITDYPHYTKIPPNVKPQFAELNALALAARDAGDYGAYWALRRRFLLAQAAAYVRGGGAA